MRTLAYCFAAAALATALGIAPSLAAQDSQKERCDSLLQQMKAKKASLKDPKKNKEADKLANRARSAKKAGKEARCQSIAQRALRGR